MDHRMATRRFDIINHSAGRLFGLEQAAANLSHTFAGRHFVARRSLSGAFALSFELTMSGRIPIEETKAQTEVSRMNRGARDREVLAILVGGGPAPGINGVIASA